MSVMKPIGLGAVAIDHFHAQGKRIVHGIVDAHPVKNRPRGARPQQLRIPSTSGFNGIIGKIIDVVEAADSEA